MPLAFFAPLFLAGIALVAVPWIIHHIRRPEREPLRFSSLMFIPKVTREVIERRRIQHLLLMLLRMAVLAALALAFARPYWRQAAVPVVEGQGTFRMILLDTSFSMGASGVMENATRLASEALSEAQPGDRTGLILFSDSPTLVAGLAADQPATDPSELRKAIESTKPSQGATAYVPALRMAQEQLLAALGGESDDQAPAHRAVIHLVSDFQKSGLPKGRAGWRLSPRIRLTCLDAGRDEVMNDAVTAVHARPTSDGKLRIQARIRNGAITGEREIETRLILGDQVVETKSPSIKALSASQVSFLVPLAGTPRIEGRVEIAGDDLPLDNARHFAWSASLRRRVTCLASAESEGGFPPALLIERAVPHEDGDPWIWESHTRADLDALLAAAASLPDVLLLCEPADDDPALSGILSHIRGGGRAWIMLRADSPTPAAALKSLLGELGITAAGPARAAEAPRGFDLLSWIDFSHPVFSPFQGERFNDFSQVRFFNHQVLAVRDGVPARVLARFESPDAKTESPAIIECAIGEGSVIVWGFSPDLSITNFARTIKFVPVVLETLNHLTGANEADTDWLVGERYTRPIAPPATEADWKVEIPGVGLRNLKPADLASWESPALAEAGFLRAGPADSDAWRTVDAVNLHPGESDLERIAPADFKLRLASPDEDPSVGTTDAPDSGQVVAGRSARREFSRLLLALLFGFLLLECWYAPRVLR